jgi:murein DD-endopeptidase MepM/ murein hydrolase activator NlpD
MEDVRSGWYPDPYRRHSRRFFDGDQWTAHVADGSGRQSTDAVAEPRSASPSRAPMPVVSGPAYELPAHRSEQPIERATVDNSRSEAATGAAPAVDRESTPRGRVRRPSGRIVRLAVAAALICAAVPAVASALPAGPSLGGTAGVVPADNVFPIAHPEAGCWDNWAVDRGGRTHQGVDCGPEQVGVPLVAVESGTIVNMFDPAEQEPCKQGWALSLRGASGVGYYYGHLDQISVGEGDPVTRGQVIGTLGQTGNAHPSCGGGGPHLHFQIKPDGANWVDPQPYVEQWPIIDAGEPPPGGSPPDGGDHSDPVGAFDHLDARDGGQIGLYGWAVDPDTPTTPISVHVYVTGSDGARRPVQVLMADESRPDLPDHHPTYGDLHGYSTVIGGLPAGSTSVDVYGIDSSGNPDDYAHIGTKTIDVTSGAAPTTLPAPAPTPAPTTAPATTPTAPSPPETAPPPTTSPPTTTPVTATPNPPPPTAPPTTTPVTTAPPVTTVPAPTTAPPTTAPGTPPETDGADPVGVFDRLDRWGKGTIGIYGWAADPDTPTVAITVHLDVTTSDGQRRQHVLTANHSRPDIAGAYPEYGPDHGWDTVLTGLPSGSVKVDVFAVDSSGSADDHTHLGTRWIVIP